MNKNKNQDGYVPTIGLEVHVELKTKTKMFCSCLNDPNEKHPNVNICPICMGHPGTLPVANENAIKEVLMVGKALGGKIAGYSQFDRKNYFYPDLPKGYQISQYKNPLIEGGVLETPKTKAKIQITRVHLEEDTGSLLHDTEGCSLIDFNRAGIPLMELVTEPCINSSEEACEFAKELRLLLRFLGVSDADMEKGQMRIEANISVSDADKLGTKVEVKNLNSFRAVERAIEHEIKRQKLLLKKGEKITQETRGWDENRQETFLQREKESSHDYRYFPEPDIPPLKPLAVNHQLLALPELPWQKRKRFAEEYGLKENQAEILISNKQTAEYFEEAVEETIGQAKGEKQKTSSLCASYIVNDLQNLMKEKMLSADELLAKPDNFGQLMAMIYKGKINSRLGKEILKNMVESGKGPLLIIEELGLVQNNDENFILELIDRLILENKKAVDEYKAGKDTSIQFLVGQGMKMTKGGVNPQTLANILKEKLK